MCYPDGSAESQPLHDDRVPARRRRDPADLRLRPRRLLQPRPGRRAATCDRTGTSTRSAFMGSCAQLGMACGDSDRAPPPVNTALPTVAGPAQPGAALDAPAPGRGSTARRATRMQWQRAAGGGWANIPGAVGPNYLATERRRRRRPARGRHGDQRGRLGDRRPRAPTAPVAAIAPAWRRRAEAATRPSGCSIALRDRARHAKGTLAARVVAVPAGREVRTTAAKVAVTPGTWRLRLCAGPKTGACAAR